MEKKWNEIDEKKTKTEVKKFINIELKKYVQAIYFSYEKCTCNFTREIDIDLFYQTTLNSTFKIISIINDRYFYESAIDEIVEYMEYVEKTNTWKINKKYVKQSEFFNITHMHEIFTRVFCNTKRGTGIITKVMNQQMAITTGGTGSKYNLFLSIYIESLTWAIINRLKYKESDKATVVLLSESIEEYNENHVKPLDFHDVLNDMIVHDIETEHDFMLFADTLKGFNKEVFILSLKLIYKGIEPTNRLVAKKLNTYPMDINRTNKKIIKLWQQYKFDKE